MKKHRYTQENIKIVNELFTYSESYIQTQCKHFSEEKLKLFRGWIYRNRSMLIDWKIDMPSEPVQALYGPILKEIRGKLEDDKRLTI